METKIIVLTPVRNESWILDRFLSVTSQFADLIIVADQNSTDGSINIYKKYEKVHLIRNEGASYDESSRQLLLIETARKLMPDSKRILLALDADEILAADAITNIGWQTMINASPGTVLYFEKPDLYLTPYRSIRYDTLWPFGYIDDNAEHKPLSIHSIRIPQPAYAKKLYLHDIKFMHYSLNRISAQNSKQKYYSMLENILSKNHFLARRKVYAPNFNYVNGNKLQPTPNDWFEGWEKMGIDMKSIQSESKFWYEDEALKLFAQYGYRKFWLDNIWDIDWSALSNGMPVIKNPPYLLKKSLSVVDKIYKLIRKFK